MSERAAPFFPRRRVGCVTPSANPAFEPELRALLPDDVAIHAARLPVMPGTTLMERNARYIDAYPAALASYGELTLDAACIGLTGPSYALSVADDIALQARLSAQAGRPVILPSRAIADALAMLGIGRAVLFSPYPGWLTDRAETYWRAVGLDVIEVFKVSEVFRAYEMEPAEVIAALRRLRAPDDAAVVMSGTGMASLDALAACQGETGALLLPSNLAVAWALLRTLGEPPPPKWQALSPRLAARLATASPSPP